jgi:hypothetical protein
MRWSPFAAWPASHSAPAIQRQDSSGRETGPRITVGGKEASAILKRGRAPSSPIVPHRNNHDQCVERRWRGRSVGCIGGSTVRHAEGAGHVDTVTAPTESRSREETIASYLLGVHPDPVGSAPAASEKLSNRGWGNDPEVEASAGPDSGWTANPYAISAWRRRGLAGGCGEVRTTRWVHDRRGQERTREDRRGQDRREGAHTDLRVQIQYSTE